MAHKRVLSFKYAFSGLWIAFKDEPNFKVHLLMALVAVLLGIYFQISNIEWLAIIISIGLVLSLELTNTAIEEIVDSFTSDTHPGAKKAKDVAAGAVLLAALTALILGVWVFLPYIADLI
jgi:undecaprenol kinase